MLPTLAARFEQLVLVDLETRQAREVQQEYGLGNVEIVEDDIAALDFGSNPFDAIVAADVLEHFKDLALPVKTLRNSLKPGGLLFTSLPTENWVYRLLRRIFGITKPWDHYHTGYEVEDALKKNGFVRVRAKYIPLGIPLAPLFLVTAWKKGSDLVAP